MMSPASDVTKLSLNEAILLEDVENTSMAKPGHILSLFVMGVAANFLQSILW